MIIQPKIVVLDSSTIGKVSRDFFSDEGSRRSRARAFVLRLADSGTFIAFSTTHLYELLRHGDKKIADQRFLFCRQLPLIAWVRPYDNMWFPGAYFSIYQREFHARIHDGIVGWEDIVAEVRGRLWETGVGTEMFVDNGDGLWEEVRRNAQDTTIRDKVIASIRRTDPGEIHEEKVADLKKLPRRERENRRQFLREFAANLAAQIATHGDKSLPANPVAAQFATDTLRRIEDAERNGHDVEDFLFNPPHIPPQLMTPDLTVGEYGDLSVVASIYAAVGETLSPAAEITLHNTPVDAIPAYALDRAISKRQVQAERVSGSDLGDSNLACLALYSDHVEMDKRTFEFTSQVERQDSRFCSLVKGRFFKASGYEEIPDSIGI